MTRRKKFNVGDLVVLKKGVKVEPYPSLEIFYYRQDIKQKALDEIALHSNVKHVVRRVKSYNPNIQPGTVGLIQGYSNVFMLEYDRISNEIYEKLSYAKKQQVLRAGSDIYLNRSGRQHMHVLIDERLIAFKPGAKLFEPASDALLRYENVDVRVESSIRLHRANDTDVKNQLSSRLRQLRAIFDDSRVVQIECIHRDGTVEKKDPTSVMGDQSSV